MYDSILVPTDGSERISETLDHAVQMAENHGATVHALSVVDERKSHSLPESRREEALETMEKRAERAVEDVVSQIEAEGLAAASAIRNGAPAEKILQYAEKQDVDAIVIGTRGRSDHERFVRLGSVTQRVVENAKIPVLVVDLRDEDATGMPATGE